MTSRREFLKAGSAAAAYLGLGAPTLSAAAEPTLGLIFPPLNYPIPPDARLLYPGGVRFIGNGVGLAGGMTLEGYEEAIPRALPRAMDLVKEPEKKQILYLHFAPQAMGRPFAAPPDIPADRKAALIKAFDNAMRDPELLTEATKQRMDIDPMTGRQIDDLLAQIYATPPDVVAKAAQAIAE